MAGSYRRIPLLDGSAHAIALVVAALVFMGLLMVYSTRAPYLARTQGLEAAIQPFVVQAAKVTVGIGFFIVGLFVSPAQLLRLHRRIFWVALAMLVLVLVPGFGVVLNGARRWFVIGGLVFQPMELARLALVIYLAARLTILGRRVQDLGRGFLPLAGVLLGTAVLLLLQPDFGSAMLFLGTGLLILILGGARVRHFLVLAGIGLPLFSIYAFRSLGHVSRRLHQFLEPGLGDQAYQSMIALGSGGVGGADLGAGMSKLGYLPMISSDFILAAIGEEMGFIGTSLVVLLFLLFTLLGLRIVTHQGSRFLFLLGAGILFSISVPAVINIAVVTGAAPTKGIALPFVSAGGSAMAISLFGVGVLAGMARRSRRIEVHQLMAADQVGPFGGPFGGPEAAAESGGGRDG